MTKLANCLQRIKKLQGLLADKEGCVIENGYDLFYLTGLQLSLGHLYILKKGVCLFVDGRYFEVAKKKGPVAVAKLSEENQLAFLKGVNTLFVDGDKLTHSSFLFFQKLTKKVGAKANSSPKLFKDLRLIKDKNEIAKMKKSAEFAYGAYQRVKRKLKPGVTEIELAKALEIDCLSKGAEKMSFDPIIAFGKNTALPHHHPGKTKLKAQDIVLFDLGVVLDGYCSDMTRVDFVGKVDPVLKHLHTVNKEAQRAALELCRPGVALKELDQAARKVMARAKLEDYFIHSLGHGIGLEVHEYPRVSSKGADQNLKLEVGMAITIEPGLYLPGKGGVRYEDTIIITPKGVMNLYPL